MLDLLLNNQWYLFYLGAIMMFAGAAKQTGIFIPLYRWIIDKVKSKRAVVALISTLTGILPITGRVSVSAGFLDTIAPEGPKRRLFGIIDYLSTHHYYLWSPLEKSVIIPMAVLGLSYTGLLGIMAPVLIGMFAVILYYIFWVLKEEDIDIDTAKFDEGRKPIDWNLLQHINWSVIAILAGIIVFGNFAKEYTDVIKAFVENNTSSLIVASLAAFSGSLLLGSSSRFAAITAIATTVFGPAYLVWFFTIDFVGYMLSPAHKCLAIGKLYFDTPLKEYYKAIGLLSVVIVTIAAIQTFIF